jgi:homoserine O-succinyltransferase
MPIRIKNDLPAKSILEKEDIFVMPEERAEAQDIRPLKILLLNLMPTKNNYRNPVPGTSGQYPDTGRVDFVCTYTYTPTNTPAEHLIKFYEAFDDVKDRLYDGMIITGAPVENMPFERSHTGRSSAASSSGPSATFIPHSTFAGPHRQACITITAYPSTPCRKKNPGFSPTR